MNTLVLMVLLAGKCPANAVQVKAGVARTVSIAVSGPTPIYAVAAYVDGREIGVSYQNAWTPSHGCHVLKASAWDVNGVRGDSQPIYVEAK